MCEFIKPPTHFAGDHSRSCWRVCCCPKFVASKAITSSTIPEDIVNQAHKEADNIKKEKLLEAKEENQILREQTEAELRERRSELRRQEPNFSKRRKLKRKYNI